MFEKLFLKLSGRLDLPRLKIISGCDNLRFKSFVNHQIFAQTRGAEYSWKFNVIANGENPYVRKIDLIEREIGSSDWLFWIDDDAYFTDFSWDIMSYIEKFSGVDLVICKSPVNEGRWTFISSGQFFLKSTRRALDFLKAVKSTQLTLVREWWNEERYGLYTGGDQDLMVYVLSTDDRFKEGKFFIRMDYPEFNSREFHYMKFPDQHRLLHLASNVTPKVKLLENFRQRFSLNEFLVPDAILDKFQVENYRKMRI